MTHHAIVIRNLLSRDADCRCGNMRLTEREIESLEHAAKILGLTERPPEKEGK